MRSLNQLLFSCQLLMIGGCIDSQPVSTADQGEGGIVWQHDDGLELDTLSPCSERSKPKEATEKEASVIMMDCKLDGSISAKNRPDSSTISGSIAPVSADSEVELCSDLVDDAGIKEGNSEQQSDLVNQIDSMSSDENQPIQPGDLVITEIMSNPTGSDAEGEWLEIHNPSLNRSISLHGCALGDESGERHLIEADLVLSPSEYIVMARGENPGFIPNYSNAGFSLTNTADSISILCNGMSIDNVTYSKNSIDNRYPLAEGRSMSLDPAHIDATANDRADFWCFGVDAYNGTDYGTPGAPNNACTENPIE